MKILDLSIHRDNLPLRFQQLVILILHLLLLYWITFVLNNTGNMEVSEVLYHFTGMSIAGALLIRGCAAWGKRLYEKEQNDSNSLRH